MKTLRNKNKSGFTLIELLVVIAIIGLLASVVLLALNSARAKARDAKRLADVRQIASGLEIFYNDRNSYPTQAGNAAVGFTNVVNNLFTPTYIGLVPVAPTPADSGCTGAYNGGVANDYIYSAVAVTNVSPIYTLSFCLGAQTGGYAAGIHTLTQAGIQ